MAKRRTKQKRRGLFWKPRTPDDETVLREAAFGDPPALHRIIAAVARLPARQ